MNVLSLFDGMSAGQIALERAGIKVDNYFASEIDKYAIKITQKNYPDTIQLGGIENWRNWQLPEIDLIIGGSPCQGFSFAGKQLNFNDPRSKLFFTFCDVLKSYKPKWFLLENVKMKKEYEMIISYELGNAFNSSKGQMSFMGNMIMPMLINSALVSAQNRQRLYWFNWEIGQPDDKRILLGDILENGWTDKEKSYCIDANYYRGGSLKNYLEKSRRQVVLTQIKKKLQVGYIQFDASGKGYKSQPNRIYFNNKKSCSLTKEQSRNIKVLINKNEDKINYRKLTPVECERLQTVPDNYTLGVSSAQRYKMLGNGWTVDIIAHILKGIKA